MSVTESRRGERQTPQVVERNEPPATFDMEALRRTITDTIRHEMAPIQERLGRVERQVGSETSVQGGRDRQPQVRQRDGRRVDRREVRDDVSSHRGDYDPSGDESDDFSDYVEDRGHGRRGGQNNMRNLKLSVPSF